MHAMIELTVNGDRRTAGIPAHYTLLETLRYALGLTGSKQGCDKGDCGACTVLLDGEPILSCITPAWEAEGRSVTTVEGIASPGALHPLQDAFEITGGAQCGFCTPGVLMSAHALLACNQHPTRDEIRDALSGNLCRCTGYTKIYEAVEIAAARLGENGSSGNENGGAGNENGSAGNENGSAGNENGSADMNPRASASGRATAVNATPVQVPASDPRARANPVPPDHHAPVIPSSKVTEE